MSPLKDGIVILILVIFFFGAKKLPELSRSLGQSVKEFRGGINEAPSANQELPAAPATTPTATPTEQSAGQQPVQSAAGATTEGTTQSGSGQQS